MTGPDDGIVRAATADFAGTLAGVAAQLVQACALVQAGAQELVVSAEELVDTHRLNTVVGPDEDRSHGTTTVLLQELVDDGRAHEVAVATVADGVAVLAEGIRRVHDACRRGSAS